MGNVGKTFKLKDWDLELRAELYKAEFFASRAWREDRDGMVNPWEASTRKELDALRALKEGQRSEHIGEIDREQDGAVVIGYWYEFFTFAPTDRPRTDELMHASLYLAGAVATYFKARFRRPRPSLLAPDLEPPIPLPGLPSYPGGHAAQVELVAKLLIDLGAHGGSRQKEEEILKRAREVASNRERAGLNYRSDTEAGRELAKGIFEILTGSRVCPATGSLKRECVQFWETLERARVEW